MYPPTRVERPARVFLLDHGRTSSLVLPQGEALVRYSYGEWDWYARNRTGVFRGSGALGVGTRGALGRRALEAGPDLSAVRAALAIPIESAWRIDVPADKAQSLARDLDRVFRARAGEAVDNPRMGLRFVPHPADYSLAQNSNHMTATWLRRMDCRVEMRGPLSHWRVVRGDSG
ncbi:MAG: hypothetical protein WD382_02280 [Halofilum sp. (in: g-proteobacteria)]